MSKAKEEIKSIPRVTKVEKAFALLAIVMFMASSIYVFAMM